MILRGKCFVYLMAIFVLAVVSFVGLEFAMAVTFQINSTEDATDTQPGDGMCETASGNGICTLRAAIQEHNRLGGINTINLPAGLYTLTIPGTGENEGTTGDLDIYTGTLTINGSGASTTIIQAGKTATDGIDRVFDINTAVVNISGVTIRYGRVSNGQGGRGGGIYSTAGALSLTNVTISDNFSDAGNGVDSGGGIYSEGTLNLSNCIITRNSGSTGGGMAVSGTTSVINSVISSNSLTGGLGGGIYNTGALTIVASTISGNITDLLWAGGGIFNNGSLILTESTVVDNEAGMGGGIVSQDNATITNTTISGNEGGGIFNTACDDCSVSIINSTISNNTGVGVQNMRSLSLKNVIVAYNTINCDGVITSDGHNLDSGGTCGFKGPGDLQNIDPLLGPLQDNSGPTFTHALLPGSPAIDAAAPDTFPPTDQRGVPRPQGKGPDIGSYESLSKAAAPQISAGMYSVYLKSDGTLWTCGLTGYSPGPIGGGTNWALITIGSLHAMALKTDGTLWGWGHNGWGQLGNGTFSGNSAPLQTGTEADWALVAAGGLHTVAVKTNGTLWAWGRNTEGQLGDGTTESKSSPVQIETENDWAAITAGDSHTIALKTDGTLWIWGSNNNGQLGDGTTENRLFPVQIGADTDWRAIAAGNSHTVALKSDGSIWAWGYNGFGQVGDGTTSTKFSPTKIGSDTDWVAIEAGGYHTVALKSDGALWAWGGNYYGQLGDGTMTDKISPIKIGTNTDWKTIAAGESYTVALKMDESIWAWGNNEHGQLGNGTTNNEASPVQIPSVGLTITKSGSGNGSVTSTPQGIDCGADCFEVYLPGQGVTLTATPDIGSTFVGWTGDADCSDGAVTMNVDKTCTATFNTVQYTLTVTKSGTGNGTVTSTSPGINCGSTCTASYTEGTNVTLTALADAGSTFVGWSGGGCSGTGPCTISLNSDTTITASFVLLENCAYTISPANKTFNARGGSVSIKVSATGQTNCPVPTVFEDAEWISVSGTPTWKANKGTVKIAVQKNPGSQSRTGVVSIGGQNLTIQARWGDMPADGPEALFGKVPQYRRQRKFRYNDQSPGLRLECGDHIGLDSPGYNDRNRKRDSGVSSRCERHRQKQNGKDRCLSCSKRNEEKDIYRK